jgi:hypothetical protein
MSRSVHPHQSARVERMASGLIPSGPHTGKPVTITLYSGLASAGWKTEYNRVPKRWYEITAPEVKDERGRGWRQCWSFSGIRYEAAADLFDRDLRELALTLNVGAAVSESEACPRCGSPESPCDCPDGMEGYEISPKDGSES